MLFLSSCSVLQTVGIAQGHSKSGGIQEAHHPAGKLSARSREACTSAGPAAATPVWFSPSWLTTTPDEQTERAAAIQFERSESPERDIKCYHAEGGLEKGRRDSKRRLLLPDSTWTEYVLGISGQATVLAFVTDWCVLQNSRVEAPALQVTVFGGGASKEVRKVKEIGRV